MFVVMSLAQTCGSLMSFNCICLTRDRSALTNKFIQVINMKVGYAILMLNQHETGSLTALICLRTTEMQIETNPSCSKATKTGAVSEPKCAT